MIPLPLALIACPLLLAMIIYVIRRLTIPASILSVISAVLLTWFVRAAPALTDERILGGWVVGGEQIILGRPLVFAPSDQPLLLALCVAATVVIALAAALPRSSGRPDDTFFPGVIGLIGIAAAVLVTETFVFSVILIQVAVTLITALLQGARFGSTQGAWRFFLFNTLSLPFLLVAGWQIDFQAANPGQTDLLNPAVLLLTLGFAISMAAFPFHLWLAPAAKDTHPLVQPVAFGFFHMITLSVIGTALDQFPWYAESQVPFQWFLFLGTLTAGTGTLLAFSSSSFGHLTGYTLLVDMGGLLLVLGTRDPASLQVAWAIILLRTASLTAWGTALAIIRAKSGADQIADIRNLGRSFPLLMIVLLLAGLGLSGFPLGLGFSGRWMATGLVARESMGRAAILLLGSASSVIGMLRMTRNLFHATLQTRDNESAGGQQSWVLKGALVAVLLGVLVLGIYPNPITDSAAKIASYLSR